MKSDLQRIEAALKQLDHYMEPSTPPGPSSPFLEPPDPSIHSPSFPISSKVRASSGSQLPYPASSFNAEEPWLGEEASIKLAEAVEHSTPTADHTPQLSLEASRAPALPKLEISDFTALSHDSEQILQMIRALEALVAGWHSELHQILQRIRIVETEGPAINGWLESKPLESSTPDVSVLRHAEVDQLMDYISEICCPSPHSPTPKARYVLCGYNANGQIWSRPCPPEELSNISMAIARYQTLSQLRERQQSLERRLGAIALQVLQLYQQHVS